VEAGLAGVYKGTLTPQQGSAIASLAGAWVRLHEHGEMDAWLEALEQAAQTRKGWHA
jgi:hypothetical protein